MHHSCSVRVAALTVALFSLMPGVSQAAATETIDKMVTGTFGGYTQTYTPGGAFMVFPSADHYVLNDGSSWESGAGWHPTVMSTVSLIELDGDWVKYTFEAPADGVLYTGTDYSFGDHSAQGVLGVTGDLTLVARRGSKTGTMSGYTTILSNDATWYDSFNHYSASVGQQVYFETTYTLVDARFTRFLFQREFTYNEAGFVDFTQVLAVPEASTGAMWLVGCATLGLLARRRRSHAAT